MPPYATMRLISLSLLILCCSSTIADDEGEWQHGVSMFDEFKYSADFEHFEYANPEAPKGGTLVQLTAATRPIDATTAAARHSIPFNPRGEVLG